MKRPLAYITAPWSNSQYENAENAAAYCRQVYDAGYSPICPVLFLPTFLKDEIPQEHKDGLDMARDYLRRSHVSQLFLRQIFFFSCSSECIPQGSQIINRHYHSPQ